MPPPAKNSRGASRSAAAPSAARTPRTLHARFWVETDGRTAMNDAAADLLEQIEACGSLSEAARRLRFSYRRAWMLLDLVNQQWPGPLVESSIGGRGGGGAELTELGRHVLRTYRSIQLQMEHLVAELGDPFVPLP